MVRRGSGATMRVNTSSRYSVRALFDLAFHGGGRPTQVKDISRRQKLSPQYLEQIFNRLVRQGILKSKRGPHGGYLLAREPASITVGAIIRAAQGPIVPVACLAEDARKDGLCRMIPECVTRHVWRETQRRLTAYYDSVTIADLCKMADRLGMKRDGTVEHDIT